MKRQQICVSFSHTFLRRTKTSKSYFADYQATWTQEFLYQIMEINEADIPIDIHTGKLLEWLISRRIIPKNFQVQIRDVRNKISNALKDMPEDEELVKLLSGAHINYFHCQKIIEILKQTEKDSKSVFGIYGSKRMKDWQEIIKLYERENIYLGEAAQILVRNLNYEIPGVRKQMAKFEQQREEALKRVQDLGKSKSVLLVQHNALCTQLGIKGENVANELRKKLEELPQMYADSISGIESLKDAVELYSGFSKAENHLPILKHVIKFGNTTVYEYVHKEAPLRIEENQIQLNCFSSNDAGNDSPSAEIIDFGDSSNSGVFVENIDFGDETAADEIEFDVPLEEYGIVVEGVGMDGGVAKGDQAFTILDSPQYRDKFIDELYELESFWKLRQYELNILETSSNILFSLMDNLSMHDRKSINKILSDIDSIMRKVLKEDTRHLFQLKHSAKYAEILAGKLEQKIKATEKLQATSEVLKEKSIELNKQKLDQMPILNDLIAQTKVLQQQIEKDISKRYKNRIVNLMGGINSL